MRIFGGIPKTMITEQQAIALGNIHFLCPWCAKFLSVAETMVGERVECPSCNLQAKVPRESTEDPPSVSPFPAAWRELQYWLERDGEVRGPYAFEILAAMWDRKELRLTDRLCEQGTEKWIEVASLMKLLEQAAEYLPEKHQNPPGFGFVMLLSGLLPIIGVVIGIVWLSQPKFRSAGVAVVAMAVACFLMWFVYFSCSAG